MSLTELEQHAYAYYVATDAAQFQAAPRFYPYGELTLILADKIQVATRKFGHPTITCEDTHAARELFERTLDFRLSDEIGDGLLFFLRCNVDHHGMGIQKGPPERGSIS